MLIFFLSLAKNRKANLNARYNKDMKKKINTMRILSAVISDSSFSSKSIVLPQ